MHLYKKRPRNGGVFTFVWIAVDRESGQVIEFEIGSRSKETYLKLAFRIEKQYRINHLCTDNYHVYQCYKIAKYHHKTKAETAKFESVNSLARHYMARFNRRTRCDSKSIAMIRDSLTIFFNKKLLNMNFYL